MTSFLRLLHSHSSVNYKVTPQSTLSRPRLSYAIIPLPCITGLVMSVSPQNSFKKLSRLSVGLSAVPCQDKMKTHLPMPMQMVWNPGFFLWKSWKYCYWESQPHMAFITTLINHKFLMSYMILQTWIFEVIVKNGLVIIHQHSFESLFNSTYSSLQIFFIISRISAFCTEQGWIHGNPVADG